LRRSYPNDEWKKYTNQHFFLIHSITDGLISYNKCKQNANILQLEPNNILSFQSGNHNQIRNELGILSAIDRVLQIN
jgi:hypothetical protein